MKTLIVDPFESREYQKFVESMVEHCYCKPSSRPCDGVLAGGPCDDIQDSNETGFFEDEEV